MKKVFKFKVETRFASLLIISLLITWCFTSCRDENEIGLEILPPSDTIHTIFSDTATIFTRTLLEDSLRTDELSAQLLGSDFDVINNIFGLTTASVYTQVNLEGTPAFGDAIEGDSLVLILDYSGYYGDTSNQQTLNVFQLSESMHTDSGYFSNKTFSCYPASLIPIPFDYKPMPTTKDSASSRAQIRIPLAKWLADTLVQRKGQSVYSSNANWLEYFKGLYLESTPIVGMRGAISYFNFFTSKLTLYFTDDSVKKSYDFSLAGARLNHFSHDYVSTSTEINKQVAISPDSSFPINYVQAMAGVKMKISFPFLKHFIDSGKIVINKAQLNIKPVQAFPPYSLPSKMLLIIKDVNGNNAFPLDYYEATNYYGGDLNSTSDGYTFNIGRQLQQYLDGKVDNTDFYLIVSGSGVVGNRAQILSGTNPDRMKISILYTKIN